MREILFKAKKIIDGEWIEGYMYRLSEKHQPFIMLKDRFGEGYEVDENTICQYTGLTDKNGNKIWKNNVCNCVYDGKLATRVIVWDKDELDFKGTNGKENYGTEYDYLGCCEELEVVGNIFDNPELIKSEF